MGWRNWFKLSNYSDRVVKSVIATTYAKKKLSIILILLATIIFRIHILTLLCILISTGNFYLDFVLHIIISVLVTLKSHWFYNYMSLHKHQFYLLTRYFVNNYTPERYRNWKKYGMLMLSCYLILIFFIVDLFSQYLTCSKPDKAYKKVDPTNTIGIR